MEPIILLIAIYMSFLYGLVYLSLASYPVVFHQVHGIGFSSSTHPAFGSVVGTMLGAVFVALLQPAYIRKLSAND